MADADDLVRSGAISGKQAGKFGLGKKPVPSPKKGAITKPPRGAEDADEIDQGSNQRPAFPKEGKGKETGNKKAKGKIAPEGGQYGGGGQSTQ